MTLFQYDAFTDRPFAGNPAAVCLLDAFPSAEWMQNVALEMNLSETAFVVRIAPNRFGLRWFTPSVEVDLCGHATLAAAFALWDEGEASREEPIRFDTQSGPLGARFEDGLCWLDFHAEPPSAAIDAGQIRALGLDAVGWGQNRMDALVKVATAVEVRDYVPPRAALRALGVRGLIVTARADGETPGVDFVSRFFAPDAGVDEDPVTGSAHCALGPFWAEKLGKNDLVGYQASARGGIVRVRVRGERVHLGGAGVRTATIRLGAATLP